METKHTPGPYRAGHFGLGEYRREIIFDKNCGQVAEVLEAKNVPLLAAAPDLLRAAIAALVVVLNERGDGSIAADLRAAIAKAEGR